MKATLYIYRLIDIAEELDVRQLRKKLKRLKARPLRLRHFTPAYLNFAVPPVEMDGRSWGLKPTNIPVIVQYKFYSLGSVTIRYQINFEKFSYEEVFNEAQNIINNKIFAKRTDFIVNKKIRKLVEEQLGIKTHFGFVEDYNILWIRERFDLGNPKLKTLITQFLRNETLPLSDYEKDEAYRYRFSYTPRDLTVVDWDRAVTINLTSDDDVWDVLEYANLQLLELRYYDVELNKRLEEIYRFARASRLPFLEFYRTPTLLKKTLQIFLEFTAVEERINSFLRLTGDEYLSRVYLAAAKRLNIKNTQAELKERLIDARELFETLSAEASAARIEILEIVIIILIALEIIFALFK